MLDQMFTADNFRRIFDSENRKGVDVANRFFEELGAHTSDIREKLQELRALRAKPDCLKPADFAAKVSVIKKELAELKATKSDAIDKLMEAVSSKVHESNFKLNLTEKIGPKGKAVYCIDGTPETFFVVKQLQRTINRIYGVKPSNRHDLICQIRDTVSSDFPFEIVRTDISSFYESVDRKELLAKLDTDQLLSSSSKKYIRQILSSFASITNQPVGIPRGVGISAYLAELYLRPLDQDIRTIPGIVLYCRFVDDIVAIFARPPSGKIHPPYKELILSALSKRKLVHNDQKTTSFQLGSAAPTEFEYLGYRFTLKFGLCSIAPSSTKLTRYEERVNAAFDIYDTQSSKNSRKAHRDLIARIKFLTGNTRLLNSKASAVTGVYYNNSTANDLSDLKPLDKLLKNRIELIKRPNLRKRLKLFKFTEGFSERRFHNFNAKELQRIVMAWKHV